LSMMDENHELSQSRPHLVQEMASPEVCKEYFDHLSSQLPVYVCVIGLPGDTPKMYIEKTGIKTISGVVRVFWRPEDMNIYLDMIVIGEGMDPSEVRFWETNVDNLIVMLKKVDKSKRNKGIKGIRAVTCITRDALEYTGLLDVDIFWTNESEVMV
jgi:hypothetical protein